MNKKIAGMVRLLLPVFMLAVLSASIQVVAAADTGAPAGNSVVSRSNGAMTMSGLVQTGTCSLSASGTTYTFNSMTVKEVKDLGTKGAIGQFDTELNLNNCNGIKLDITILSHDYVNIPTHNDQAILHSPNTHLLSHLYYTVSVNAASGYCYDSIISGDKCVSGYSISMPLDGTKSRDSSYFFYKPDSDSYQIKLHTVLFYSGNGTLSTGNYTGGYTYNVTYR
ncbi:hypothetical protein GZD23_003987 [Salmonella enterica subsp. enterica]|nr:hypothetical protein [Salmonella enterica subsp. enterica serovar Durban]ECO6192509.1 hypothetical protein [Salmonella enterica]EEG3130250.1 hypothetical protein [Salmonella enterica subsp. enterica serovar Nima]EDB2515909.1 hypothetical protein [Salmonella enterica]EEC4476989.1 hypothetical protein [Salmonella enterica]